ncbi:MAG TPA: ElyC/SanA/YdcF family protein [Pseudonocardiaceae bacterium]|nr:ElyC/SanA/YdcF family protein [Pseudonocardiaceae bacterium]
MERVARRRWRWALAVFVVVAVLATVPIVWERAVAGPHLRDADAVPHEQVALVFGALVDGDRPSEFLVNRLDLAVRFYRQGVVRVLLVSGNDDRHGYDEPDVMRTYLMAHGVPARRIVVDRSGFTTWDTCARAHRVFGVDSAVLITQAFHVARAVALCRANGVSGYGVGIDSASIGSSSTVYGYFREFFAADKAMWDALVTRPAPDVLGPPSDAVPVALAG